MRMYAKSNDSIYYSSLLLFKPLEANSACLSIDGGTFQMGATTEQNAYAKADEYPVRNITISDFKMGVTEVTNAQYARFLRSRVVSSSGVTVNQDGTARQIIKKMLNGLYYSYDSLAWVPVSGYENFPVAVSWYGANEYCAWAGGRLPTESEWEWAARGGIFTQQKLLSGGNASDVNQIAWYKSNTKIRPLNFQDAQIVGTKLPNELGLYDMSGNMTEWVQDWYVPYLGNNLKDDDAKESGVIKKVVRGGSWADGDDGRVDGLRTSVRNSNYPEIFVASCGFRICK
jgi:formylglycine-generating enzyme